jgi:predicted NACHT family NTPase
MNERSLHLSPEGIKKVNLALAAKNMTIERLALELKLASMYVNKFFRGEAIPTQMFAQTCEGLGLNWQELFNKSTSASPTLTIDSTVQEVRQKCHENLTRRCNRIRISDMPEPRELREIYTNINIVEELGQLHEKLSLFNDRSSILTKIGDRLKRDANSEDLDRYLNRVTVKSVPAIQVIKEYSKLIILGGVGIGKTTFLKYLVLQCLNGNFHGELVPVLISLKDFAETNQTLIDYLFNTFISYGIKDTNAIEQLLNQGSLLILLDGLDEVEMPKSDRVIAEIKNLADRFHRNHIFITCRVCDYRFEQFSEVQIAKFNDDQIQTFIRQWFSTKAMVKDFTKEIADNPALRELAETPLLLTYLCLLFDNSGFDYPFNYLETVGQCLDLYLNSWDRDRNITCRNLVVDSGALDSWSHVALIALDAGKYAFKSKYLSHYLKLSLKQQPPKKLREVNSTSDMKALLKSGLLVQRHKDTYAFSHSIFQEYLAAKKIAESSNPHAIEYLSDRFEEGRWQNIILLTAGMLVNADELLLQLHKKANQILEKQQNIQEFLDWINKNSTYLRVSSQPTTLRAFYLDIGLNNFRIQDRNRAIEITHNRTKERIKERTGDTSGLTLKEGEIRGSTSGSIDNTAFSDTALNTDYDLAIALNLDLALYVANNQILTLAGLLEPKLRRSLQTLKEQLPNPNDEEFNSWWQSYGVAWAKDCRSLLIQHRKGTQEWNFTPAEEDLLKRYHNAHVLLLNCLNTISVSSPLKQHILNIMFLPIWQQP